MKKYTLTPDILILFAALLFGAWFRISPAWTAGFPINDGGMFYTMIRDLQAQRYALPLFTTYNDANIPFAYPPLGFYIGALLSDLLNVSPISILRWLPGLVNALCIPAFYFFAKEVLRDKLQSAAATLVYALIPHLTSWYSMGGGLTRSFGALFMLLTLAFVQRLFTREDGKNLRGAIIFGALTVLSHTEAPIYTVAIALYIWAMKSRSWKGLFHGALVALDVLILAAPWYGAVIYKHGLQPFMSISQTGAHSWMAVLRILNIQFLTEEQYLGLLGVLGVLGIAALVAKRDYFIPLLLVVIFLAQPRSAHLVGNIPLALAAGFFIAEIVIPGVTKLREVNRVSVAFLSIVAIYLFVNSAAYSMNLSTWALSKSERDAMQWVKENAPAGRAFVVLTGNQDPFCDAVNEWFPTLTERKSLTTLQGTEWLLGDSFGTHTRNLASLQACVSGDAECLAREAEKLGESFRYVYVSLAPPRQNCAVSGASTGAARMLSNSLENSKDYSIVYRSDAALIFEKK